MSLVQKQQRTVIDSMQFIVNLVKRAICRERHVSCVSKCDDNNTNVVC